MPGSPLETVASGEVWTEVYDGIAALVKEHRTTLVFVNTRRLAERIAFHLGERLGKEAVSSHHGSLSREHRLTAPKRACKAGDPQSPRRDGLSSSSASTSGTSTSSCRWAAPEASPRRSSASEGRAHGVRGVPEGGSSCHRAATSCSRPPPSFGASPRGSSIRSSFPVVAMTSSLSRSSPPWLRRDWSLDALYPASSGRASPYRDVTRQEFDAIVEMLSVGIATARGRRGAHIHLDRVNGIARARKGARLTAITSGGAIADIADYEVILEPNEIRVGTLHEDFAIESSAGDIFQLGNVSYKILQGRARQRSEWPTRVGLHRRSHLWLGEAPGRSRELLCRAVSDLREDVALAPRLGAPRRTAPSSPSLISGRPREDQLVDYLRRYGQRLARRDADAGVPRDRALLRRVGRHAPRHPRPLRFTGEPGVGARAPQVLLPQVRLRAPGCGDRRRHRSLTRADPRLSRGKK